MIKFIKSVFNKCVAGVKAVGRFAQDNAAALTIGAATGAAVLGGASTAKADPVDYGAQITTNFSVIDTLWGKVAVIMISVALVVVGLRFFRKTR